MPPSSRPPSRRRGRLGNGPHGRIGLLSGEEISPGDAVWLTSDAGLAAVRATVGLLDGGASLLSVGQRLRDAGQPPSRAAAITAVAEARRRSGDALPDPLLATRTASEQASHPAVADWRARRFTGRGTVVDLCCGVGVDAVALGRASGAVVGVDLEPARVAFAVHNLRLSGVGGGAVVGDATRPPVDVSGTVHADPSRRRGSRRLRALGDYDPPIPVLTEILRPADGHAIVVSPGVDLSDPAIVPDAELEFVQVGRDLVEAVLWNGDLRRGEAARASATLLPGGITATRNEEPSPLPVGPPGEWLIRFAPAAVRARLHDGMAGEIDGARLAERRALFTTRERPDPSPWYEASRIEAVLPARASHLASWLADREGTELEFVVHGLDVDLDRFWREAGRPSRGPHGLRVHLVRLDDGAVALVTAAPSTVRADDGAGRPDGERPNDGAR